MLLLAARALCGTYEGLALQRAWGERMVLRLTGAPREGLPGTLLTLLQLGALALGTVSALAGAWQAARIAAGGKGDAP